MNPAKKETPKMYLADGIRFGTDPDGTLYWSLDGRRGRIAELRTFKENAEKAEEEPLAWAQLRGELHAATDAGGTIHGKLGDTLLSLIADEIRETANGLPADEAPATPQSPKKWPLPDALGRYDKQAANKVFIDAKDYGAAAYALQIGEDKWISAYECRLLDTVDDADRLVAGFTEPTRDRAIRAALGDLKVSLGLYQSARQKELAAKILAWVNGRLARPPDPAEDAAPATDAGVDCGEITQPQTDDDDPEAYAAKRAANAKKTPGELTVDDFLPPLEVFLAHQPDIEAGGVHYRCSTHEMRIKKNADPKSQAWKTHLKAKDTDELFEAWRALVRESKGAAGKSTGEPQPQRIKAGDTWTHPATGEAYDVVDGNGKDCDACDLNGADNALCPIHEIDGVPACSGHRSADGKSLILKRRQDGTDKPPVALDQIGSARPVPPPAQGTVTLIDAARISDSPFQIRKIDEDDGTLRELAESIKTNGLINPLLVRPLGGGNHELVAGHRRLRACRLAGLAQIPCTVREMDDTAAESALIVENLQRKDLTPLEEADSVAALLGRGYDEQTAARKLGVSVKWVYRRKAMSRATPAWREHCAKIHAGPELVEAAGRLPPGAADKILAAAKQDWSFSNHPTADALAHVIRHSEHQLAACPWNQRHPAWCETCPKRSDAAGQLDLFESGNDDADAGKPRCLDPECWKLKAAAFVREQKIELKHAHGTVLTANQYNAYTYAEKKSTTNCVPVLVTDGQTMGTVRWAPKPKDQPKAKPKEPTAEMLRKAARTEAVDSAIKKLQYGKKFGKNTFTPGLSVLAGLAVAFGMESAKDDFSQSERDFHEKAVEGKGETALAKLMWQGLKDRNITTWKKAEDIITDYRRNQDERTVEEEYQRTSLLEKALGLDEKEIDKAVEPILRKLQAKQKGAKGEAE